MWLRLLALAVAVGLVGGALLAWATLGLSTTDIAGPGWSVRGNGALIVEFAGGPALLAGGWVGLVRRRTHPGWAVLAGALTLLLELILGFAPILAGPSLVGQTALLVGVWPAVVSLVLGLALAWPPTRRTLLAGAAVCAAGIGLSLAVPFLLFFIAPLLLPLVLVMPTLARDARREHIPSLVALPIAVVVGALGTQLLPSGA